MNMAVKHRKSSHQTLSVLWTFNHGKTRREGILQSTNQMSYMSQLKFELDLLWNQRFWVWFPMESPICGTRIFHTMRLHSVGETRFSFIWWKIWFLEKTWNHHLFLFYFLRENKIRKKTLSVTPYLEKMVCEKPKLGLGIRLLIGKVQ